jgi:ABC-type branched-subunit amino acid transport system ATPase component
MRILEVVGLTKRFGRKVALDGVSFTAEEGHTLGLFGPRGAGKTTCCDCLSGFATPDGGRIILDGREITGAPPHQIARAGLAQMFQTARPFKHLSAAENVAVALGQHRAWPLRLLFGLGRRRDTGDRQALALLERVGLGTIADRPAQLLSREAQRRLEIARTLARRPKLVVLDEPFGGLNPEETAPLAELIGSLRRDGLTVVLVERDLSGPALGLVERAVVLDRGQQIASGPPDRVRGDPRVVEAYARVDPARHAPARPDHAGSS